MRKYKVVGLYIWLGLLVGCSDLRLSDLERKDMSVDTTDQVTQQYVLPQLPRWANVSPQASCERTNSIRFIDMFGLRKSFGLNYIEALQFQYLYNKEYQNLLNHYQSDFLLLRDEKKIFYDVTQRIKNALFPFRTPRFKRVHIVWVDTLIGKSNGKLHLKRWMKSSVMKRGHPIWLSMCLSSKELRHLQTELELSHLDIRFIPAEMFTFYDEEGVKGFEFTLNLSALMPDKKLYFFSTKRERPTNLKGQFVIKQID